MEFPQLKEEVKKFGFRLIRADSDDYFEAVFLRNDLASLVNKLDSLFGPRKWPSAEPLSAKISDIIKDCGGIREDQTLYFLEGEKFSAFAMLWPWSDGQRITLKLGKE